MVQYVEDEVSYIWAQMEFGAFPRSGFYNFAMFNLHDKGKKAVNKILDLGKINRTEKHMVTAADTSFPVLDVKSVKGRMIVQPPHTR